MRLTKIGKVLKAHGYKGSFTVSTATGKDSALKNALKIFIGKDASSAKPYEVVEAAWMPKAWKMTVKEVDSDTNVESLKGLEVFVEQSTLAPTKTNEYYVQDLVGLEGIDTTTQTSIGHFSELQELVLSNGSIKQHTWIFTNSLGKELQVPAVPHFVSKVDLKTKQIFLQNLHELSEEE